MLETISAFCNEPGLDGGYLLLGVEVDDDALPGLGGYKVCGVPDPDRLQQSLVSSMNGQFNERLRLDVRPELFEGMPVLAIFVPEALATQKPVYIRKDGLPRGAFRRIGSSDVVCTGDDLATLFVGRGFKPHDGEPILDADLEDIDPDAVAVYRRIRRNLKADASELEYDDLGLLRSLGCVVDAQGTWRPTVAGLVLFGSKAALRRVMPLHRIEYVVVPGREWGEGLDESITASEFRESLLTLLPRIERLVSGDLPRTTLLPAEGVAARTSPVLPDRVLREAIVNAAMHRDYKISSPIQIIRYANRLEIRNPGYSLKALERLAQPGSEPRNPAIAEVLHEMDFAETKGSGVRRMTGFMEKANLSHPIFDSDRSEQRFTITLFIHNLMSEEDLTWIADLADCNLTGEDVKALALVRELGFITNQILRFATGLDTLGASRRLKRLRELDLLSVEGRGSATSYRSGPRLRLLSQRGNLQALGGNSYALGGQSEGLGGDSTALGGDLDPLGGDSSDATPRNIAERIQAIGPRASNRAEVERIIYDLVSWRPMAAEEIAGRLYRAKNKLQENYLTPMVRRGHLGLVRTEPNHPRQRYEPGKPVDVPASG